MGRTEKNGTTVVTTMAWKVLVAHKAAAHLSKKSKPWPSQMDQPNTGTLIPMI